MNHEKWMKHSAQKLVDIAEVTGTEVGSILYDVKREIYSVSVWTDVACLASGCGKTIDVAFRDLCGKLEDSKENKQRKIKELKRQIAELEEPKK